MRKLGKKEMIWANHQRSGEEDTSSACYHVMTYFKGMPDPHSHPAVVFPYNITSCLCIVTSSYIAADKFPNFFSIKVVFYFHYDYHIYIDSIIFYFFLRRHWVAIIFDNIWNMKKEDTNKGMLKMLQLFLQLSGRLRHKGKLLVYWQIIYKLYCPVFFFL